jgi:predicted NAD-dependent protein-ADP-ribosyltransferase YbiA (DUF1768 family)
MNWILTTEHYTRDELKNAAVILHPRSIEKYGVWPDDVGMIFEQWSNFTRLKHPIEDGHGNSYHDSEGYYMAQRFENPTIKQMVALCSTQKHFSKKAAYLLQDQMEADPEKRIVYMRNALREKFLRNPSLAKVLNRTGDRLIIELTYWNDRFFGVSHTDLSWFNALWKLLMETRDLTSKCI